MNPSATAMAAAARVVDEVVPAVSEDGRQKRIASVAAIIDEAMAAEREALTNLATGEVGSFLRVRFPYSLSLAEQVLAGHPKQLGKSEE